jgi:hypothetical protein
LPAWDQRRAWAEQFLGWMKKPPCADPAATDEALRAETIATINRRNIIGVLSGTRERVARWRQDAPDRFIPGLGFQIGRDAITPDGIKALHARILFLPKRSTFQSAFTSAQDRPARRTSFRAIVRAFTARYSWKSRS